MIISTVAEQVALTTYLEEIETRIQKNRAADAIALCKHILQQYPKHLETYSLMGQALLALRDVVAALDIHRRVLSADPENVNAYADIARILDARSQPQEALWHMERAFELSPTRTDIRQDLLRLYARVEGKPRERLKLTRVALARLYIQEGLVTQALREFRDISLTNPSRYDVRVALAEALWRAGQTRQAADVAQSLLDPLPYCLKANLILGTAWRESAIEESEGFLQRAQALDPSNQAALRLLGDRSPLSVVQIKIPRYDGDLPSVEEKTTSVAKRVAAALEEPRFVIPPLVASAVEPEPKTTLEKEPKAAPPSVQAAETRDEASVEDLSIPRASEQPNQLPPSAIDSVPSFHVDEALPEEKPLAETPTVVESKPEAEEEVPDWLVELQKSFAENLEVDLPEETLPAPTANLEEPSRRVELPPLQTQAYFAHADSDQAQSAHAEIEEPRMEQESPSPATEEGAPTEYTKSLTPQAEEPEPDAMRVADEETTPQVAEQDSHPIKSNDIEQPLWARMQSVLDEESPKATEPASSIFDEEESESEIEDLEADSEEAPVPREEKMPGWLNGAPEEAIIETKLTDEEMPPWLEGASNEARAELEKPPEVKMPKWVEVLSQPPRASTPEKKTPAESRSKAEPAPTEDFEREASFETAQPERAMTEPEPPNMRESRPTEPVAPAAVSESSVAETERAQPQTKHQPKYYSRLAQARLHRDEDRWIDAVTEYDFVINKAPRLVDEVILDLEALIANGNAPLDAHRLLGDAYARAGRLNDALERYRFVYKRVSESG